VGLWLLVGLLVVCVPVRAAMPAAEQNALVKKYCEVCHTDAANNGGLSLEHYDAARRDPTLAIMILSKLRGGAMGAAGNGVPDTAAQDAWLESTMEQAAGAGEWFVSHRGEVVAASIVREVPPREPGITNAPLYRVKLSCNPATGAGDIQLTWSPQPQTGRTMTAAADGNTPVEYKIEGKESMGNAASVQSGHASVLLTGGTGGKLPLPRRSLIIRDLFPGEIVEFPFADLTARAEFGKCF
jgi:hypothetical protein